MAVAFDTLRYAETLHSSGLPEEQAKAQAKALSNALKEGIGALATKEDLAETRRALETEILEIKRTLEATSTKEDLAEVKQELKADGAKMEQELKADIADIRGDIKLLRRMAGFQMALIVAVLWLLVRLVTAAG